MKNKGDIKHSRNTFDWPIIDEELPVVLQIPIYWNKYCNTVCISARSSIKNAMRGVFCTDSRFQGFESGSIIIPAKKKRMPANSMVPNGFEESIPT